MNGMLISWIYSAVSDVTDFGLGGNQPNRQREQSLKAGAGILRKNVMWIHPGEYCVPNECSGAVDSHAPAPRRYHVAREICTLTPDVTV